MAVFIGQLIGFAVIVFIIYRYVVPPVRTLMRERQEAVRQQLEESAQARDRLAQADRYHAERVAEGRAEAQHIVSEASTDSVRITEQLRSQGEIEAERIKVHGTAQAELLRAQLIRELRGELGQEALQRAADIVKSRVAEPGAQAETIDRFLDELDSMAAATQTPTDDDTDLRPASREALASVVARFDDLAASLATDDLAQLAEDLTGVAELLMKEPMLARHLAEASGSAEAKRALVERLLAGQVGPHALEVVNSAVSVRWSASADLGRCLERVASLSLLEQADRLHEADSVAEQLFRFGRVLDEQPRLAALLGDYFAPAPGRVALLDSLLDGANGVNPIARALLAQTVALLHGERADEAVHRVAELAVARQGEIVALVGAAAPLSESQRARLTQILARIYRHPVSVQLTVDPALLGGLSITVGDEVIDGTLSSRLAAAATRLPH
jgi:ATP synthase F0 subunit b